MWSILYNAFKIDLLRRFIKQMKIVFNDHHLKPINLFEYEKLATECLSQMTLDYYNSGAGDEVTLRDNRAAFERVKLRPRMLVDVSDRNLTTKVLGQPLRLPLLIAPMAFQCLAHPEGEIATALAASGAGVGMVLSTLSTKSIDKWRTLRRLNGFSFMYIKTGG